MIYNDYYIISGCVSQPEIYLSGGNRHKVPDAITYYNNPDRGGFLKWRTPQAYQPVILME